MRLASSGRDIKTGLSTQFWDISAKNKLRIYNPMCFYAVRYSLARNYSGICYNQKNQTKAFFYSNQYNGSSPGSYLILGSQLSSWNINFILLDF
jgi:hypothetical protein